MWIFSGGYSNWGSNKNPHEASSLKQHKGIQLFSSSVFSCATGKPTTIHSSCFSAMFQPTSHPPMLSSYIWCSKPQSRSFPIKTRVIKRGFGVHKAAHFVSLTTQAIKPVGSRFNFRTPKNILARNWQTI